MRFWKRGAMEARAPTPGGRPAPPDGCATPFHPWSLLGTRQLEFQKPRRWIRLAAGGNAFSAKRTQIQNIPTPAIAVSSEDLCSEHKCETNPNDRKTEGGRSLTPKHKDARIQKNLGGFASRRKPNRPPMIGAIRLLAQMPFLRDEAKCKILQQLKWQCLMTI